MSSRLALDGHGRKVVIVTTSTDGLPIGYVFAVLDWNGFFTPPGRAPTAQERMSARPPYESKTRAATWERRANRDDEQLAEAEAIRLAMLEQRREPADLIGRVAA
jgi:hypothetical protein